MVTKNRQEKKHAISPIVGWILLVFFLCIPFVNLAFPQLGGFLSGTSVDMLFAILIAIILLGWKNTVLFYLITFVVTMIIENISISTGFPYGVFTHFSPGPRFLEVPLLVGLGYFNFVVIAWVLADLLIGSKNNKSPWACKLGRPLVGAIIASALDVIMEPVYVLIQHQWVYPNGGGFFGMPLSNSFGWLFTVFIMLFILELLLNRKSDGQGAFAPSITQWNLQVPILVGLHVIPILISLCTGSITPLTDVLGKTWFSTDLYESVAVFAIHTMVFFMVVGVFSYFRRKREISTIQQEI